MITDREIAALKAVLDFRGPSSGLNGRLAALEQSVEGLVAEEVPDAVRRHVGVNLLPGVVLVKDLSAQIHVILHAVGMLVALPHLLDPGERVESLSLGAGNAGRPFDLTTNRRIAEFKFTRWQGNDSRRQASVFGDLFHLAEAQTEKRRVLYVTGAARPLAFLKGRRRIKTVVSHDGRLAAAFAARHGDRYAIVSDYWNDICGRVEIVDLDVLVPGLAALAGE